MHYEGGVPDGRASPRLPAGEEVHAEGLHERLDVGDADEDVVALPERAQQSRHVDLAVPLAAQPLRYKGQHLGLGRNREVVLREDVLDERNGQLLPPNVLGDGAEVPPLPERRHELVSQLLLIGAVQSCKVIKCEEGVRVEVLLDELQADVHNLVNAVLVGKRQEAGDVAPRQVQVPCVDEPDKLQELVALLPYHNLPREPLAQRRGGAQHLKEVGVLC
mmetsp:Transcript_105926/g.299459  ORF Transcript_105926/g.299459 Transcript_105926/m.299459 type:complete len:219 (+) Transcript_105926:966-1622(+)